MPDSAGDVGAIVTDAEVSGFIPSWSQDGNFSTAEELLVRGVEAEVQRECQRTFVATTYTDEEYSIAAPIIRDGIVIRRTTEFRVQQFPILEWTSLKKVTNRDTVTGLASASETLERHSYHVDRPTGIIRIVKPDNLDPFNILPGTGFPSGTMILLATYRAGDVPDDLKLLVLQIIARLHLQQKNNLWGRTSQSVDGLQNTYPDIAFTASESRKLAKFRKWIFA